MAGYLEKKGLFEAFAQQVRVVRGRSATSEPPDFLALLIGYARSFERTLTDFFERGEPFELAFKALLARRCLPHRSSLSRALFRCRSPVFASLPRALRAADVRGWLDLGNHWRHLRPRG